MLLLPKEILLQLEMIVAMKVKPFITITYSSSAIYCRFAGAGELGWLRNGTRPAPAFGDLAGK